MFRIVSHHHRFIGEAHVIISVWNEGKTWKAEYNILTKRPVEHLAQCVIDFDTTDYPPELPTVDATFMETEALQQAKIDIGLELENRALGTDQEDVAHLPVELERETITPVTLWVRDLYPSKFIDMAEGTKSPDLRRYLKMVMSTSRLRRAAT